MVLSDAKRMRAADAAAIGERRVDSLALMERAAGFVAARAEALAVNRSAALFCGAGNNGGDGVAAARLLLERGFAVRAWLVGPRERMTPDTAAMETRLLAAGGALEDYDPAVPLEGFGVLVDAMFGVGLSRPLAGAAADAAARINASGVPVVAADIASGVAADSGAVPGPAVRADATVTFSMAKPGHFVEPGCIYCGELTVCDIGIPADLLAGAGCGVEAVTGALRLPKRQPLTHKGDYGKLLVLAGSVGYTGAPSLCARAALRAGAGLVWLGVPRGIYAIEAVKNDEAMPFPLAEDADGRLSTAALPALEARLDGCGAVVAGPGLGRGEGTAALVKWLLERARVPMVLDADALWALAGQLDCLGRCAAPVILTPHEGEFARLWPERSGDRLADARRFAQTYGCVLVLKGHRTLAAFPDGTAAVIAAGNPGMAKGGSGDVLAGVLGGLLGQLPLRDAVIAGCWLHARAGDLCAGELGEYAMCATDILERLPAAAMEITER